MSSFFDPEDMEDHRPDMCQVSATFIHLGQEVYPVATVTVPLSVIDWDAVKLTAEQ